MLYVMCDTYVIYNVKWEDDRDVQIVKDENGIGRCVFPAFGWRNWLKWAETLVSIADIRTKNWTRNIPNARQE
jgi:hypothetical protein